MLQKLGIRSRSSEQVVARVKGYHDLAKELISKGVDKEERGRPMEALPFYKQGLQVIQEGLEIPIPKDSELTARQREEIERCTGDVLKWNADVQERVQVIESLGASESSGRGTAAAATTAAASPRAAAQSRPSWAGGGGGGGGGSGGSARQPPQSLAAVPPSPSTRGRSAAAVLPSTAARGSGLLAARGSGANRGRAPPLSSSNGNRTAAGGGRLLSSGRTVGSGRGAAAAAAAAGGGGGGRSSNRSSPTPGGALVRSGGAGGTGGGGGGGGGGNASLATAGGRTRNGAAAVARNPVRGVDPKFVEMIESEIVDRSPSTDWEDIAGLDHVKQVLTEIVILPSRRSDLFRGLRAPAKGILLYGPPGNGKTMLAKAVARAAGVTFFSISASSLTSKWVGEGEKLMRALFAVAAARQPSVIFIDEIDSILSVRSSGEHEASRRLKTEFLVQFDGMNSGGEEDRVIVIGATNRPGELDDAVRRRLVRRIYIPLPDAKARRALLTHLLKGQAFCLPERDLEKIVVATDGYSGSDLHAVCREAAMQPIRELGSSVSTVQADEVRPLALADFKVALKAIKPSVSRAQLAAFEQFSLEFGAA
ncbi:hypothetical protein CBR_g39027 [Chara braunii]|uniref:microtubule-severing ATPase n=1 Tax=Chara braunii TaxID=69332 RepID=A0A388LQW0_CHABU|nr:hypothetical protein CBR_g39027 [Chara braunii]|eukprot:GBG84651.1 hypothetical protein CBR_g39027 [Chara braunii]